MDFIERDSLHMVFAPLLTVSFTFHFEPGATNYPHRAGTFAISAAHMGSTREELRSWVDLHTFALHD